MNQLWQIQLLGELRVQRDELRVAHFRTRKSAALLAYLAFYPGRRHAREDLAFLLWPDADLEASRNNFRQALSSLRHQLEPPGIPGGPVFDADRQTVQLMAGAVTTDVIAFESALKSASLLKEPTARIRSLSLAVECYDGPLLPGYEEEWIWLERPRLAESCRRALHQLVMLYEDAGDFEGALNYGWRAVRADPLDEDAHFALMRSYAATGQTQAALHQYEELTRRLHEDLGESPSEAICAFAQRLPHTIHVQTHVLDTPTLSSLPLFFTRFFNRTEEVLLLRAMLDPSSSSPPGSEVRLVTLTGMGGTGKTRLAAEAMGSLIEKFDGAIWFVALADLRDAGLVPAAIADVLRLPRSGEMAPTDQIIEALAHRPSLLILDNFEHLTDGGASLIQRLLEQVPALKCLVTSRQTLGLSAEYEFVVSPLPIPLGSETPERLSRYASVQLFVDRAQRTRPDFQVTPHNAEAVAALLERLEGIPLAIELAAARAAILTPRQILEQLRQRLAFLVSRNRDFPERHRSLLATIEWSYYLLPPPAQRLFRQLSVFRGGWDLAGAEGVCGGDGTLEWLQTLRANSLILTEITTEAGEEHLRYRMFETLCTFGQGQLSADETQVLARLHADYFRQLAKSARTHFQGPEQILWLNRLEQDHDNLRAALTWLRVSEEEAALDLAGQLWPFWEMRGHIVEGRRWLRQTLAASLGRTAARAQALHGAGILADAQDDPESALAHTEESVTIFRELGDWPGLASPLAFFGYLYRAVDPAQARAFLEESLAICRKHADQLCLTDTLCCLGRLDMAESRYAEASAFCEESLAVSRQIQYPQGIAESLHLLGNMALVQEDFGKAHSLLEKSLALYRELGNQKGLAYALYSLGEIAFATVQNNQAQVLLEESLKLLQQIGNPRNVIRLLHLLASLAWRRGDAAAAQAFQAEARAFQPEP